MPVADGATTRVHPCVAVDNAAVQNSDSPSARRGFLFVPLGAYVSVLTRWAVVRTTQVVASASAAVEVLQGVFALGASDVDDVILNASVLQAVRR